MARCKKYKSYKSYKSYFLCHVHWCSRSTLSLEKAEKAVFQFGGISGVAARIDFLDGQFCRICFQPAPRIKTGAAGDQKTGFLQGGSFLIIALKPVEHLAYLREWLYRGQQFRKRPDTVEYHRFPAICRRLQYHTQILPLNIQ